MTLGNRLGEEAPKFVTDLLCSQDGDEAVFGLGAQCLLLALGSDAEHVRSWKQTSLVRDRVFR